MHLKSILLYNICYILLFFLLLLFSGNVFVTYSSDISSEMLPFADFLTKHGFRPAVSYFLLTQKTNEKKQNKPWIKLFKVHLQPPTLISQIDIFDNPVRCMDINKWKDRHLKDVSESAVISSVVWCENVDTEILWWVKCVFLQPSTLIIIAISPKYKEDVEGFGVDSHSLHTRYIYAMVSANQDRINVNLREKNVCDNQSLDLTFPDAEWIYPTRQFEFQIHTSAVPERIPGHFQIILLYIYFFSLFSPLCPSLKHFLQIKSVDAETRADLAPEHARLPVAAGHRGFAAAAAEGGEIHSSSGSRGTDAPHQACAPQLCSRTVKTLLCLRMRVPQF